MKIILILFYFLRTAVFWIFFTLTASILHISFYIPRKFNAIPMARLSASAMSRSIKFYLFVFCGIKIKINNLDMISKKTGHIFVVNHQSDLETFLLSMLVPHARFIIKQELLNVPVFGSAMRDAGYISINRKGGAKSLIYMINTTKQALEMGDNIIIFPQGTRTELGKDLKLLRGVIGIIKNCQAPIIIGIHNSGQHWLHKNFYFTPGVITFNFKLFTGNKKDKKILHSQLYEAMHNLIKENNANETI